MSLRALAWGSERRLTLSFVQRDGGGRGRGKGKNNYRSKNKQHFDNEYWKDKDCFNCQKKGIHLHIFPIRS